MRQWLLLLLLICSAIAAPDTRFQFEMPADLQLIDQRQLGIFHYALAGHISSTNESRYATLQWLLHTQASHVPSASVPIKLRRKSYSGTLHFFLRGAPFYANGTYQGLNITGFAVFMDAAKAYLWNGIKHEQPSFFVHFTPRIFVRDPFGNEINATVVRAHEGKRPLHLSLFLPSSWAEAKLMVERFRRTFSLNNLIDAARASTVKPSPTVQVYNVIGQFHGLAKGTAVRLLRMHIDWHRALGVAADFVYITSEYIKYLDDPSLEPYLSSDLLLPVLWDVFPRIDQVVHYDQVMVYSHALLALWRRNAYAFLTDIDELLVTPAPATVPDLLQQGCLRGVHQALIDSFGTYCEGCLPGGNAAGRKGGDGHAPVSELELWDQETLSPLTRYMLRSENIIGLPKVLAHADYVTHVFVHSGFIQPELQGETLRLGSDRGCVWIAHLRNLLGTRETERGLMVHDRSWMWPLADIDPSLIPKGGWESQEAVLAAMHTPRVGADSAEGDALTNDDAAGHDTGVDWSLLDEPTGDGTTAPHDVDGKPSTKVQLDTGKGVSEDKPAKAAKQAVREDAVSEGAVSEGAVSEDATGDYAGAAEEQLREEDVLAADILASRRGPGAARAVPLIADGDDDQ